MGSLSRLKDLERIGKVSGLEANEFQLYNVEKMLE